MPAIVTRSDAGDLASEVNRLEQAQTVFSSDISVFSTGQVKRISPGQEIKSAELDNHGELILPTGDGCGRYVSEMAKALSEKAAAFNTRAGEAYAIDNVNRVPKDILENSFKWGSAGGEDIYVGWNITEDMMVITIID
jgi:hypothetical protein